MSIKIENISKSYNSNLILDNINLEIKENKIYGLLGRNGAGKTTLLNIISNRTFSDSGYVSIDDLNSQKNDEALRSIFITSEYDLYPDDMKINSCFEWTAFAYPLFDIEYCSFLCEKFELDTNKKFKHLSTGYKTIFKFICALSSNAKYIFLDEPVLGLDANHRDLFYKLLIEKYSNNPFTIIISTHLIEEISSILENVFIISNKKIVINDSVENLLSKAYSISGNSQNVDTFIKDKKVIDTENIGNIKIAYIIDDCIDTPFDIEIQKMDLQQLFIKLTNS